MKRLAAFTTSLLTAISGAGGAAAYADVSDVLYFQDQDFIKPVVFSALSDYAVDGDIYAFAEDNEVIIFRDGSLTRYDYKDDIAALDFSEDTFYWQSADDIYSLTNQPDSKPEKLETEYEFSSYSGDLVTDNYIYYYDEEGALTVHDKTTKETKTFDDGEYTKLKQYGDKVYAVKENVLYAFSGAQQNQINLEFADFTPTQEILIANAKDKLNTNYKLEFVTVQQGSYMTEVDLTTLDGDCFITGETVTADKNTVALLLYRASGNNENSAEIIAIGDKSYILLASKTDDKTNVTCYTEPEFEIATVIGNRIYASPYVIIGTSATDPDIAGKVVNVTNKLVLDDVLGSVFYEVQYENKNGVFAIGYVAEGFLREYEMWVDDNKNPEEKDDPEYDDSNDVVTVLLIFSVIVLVLIAIGYLTYAGTHGSKKDNKESDKNADKKAKK